MLAATESTASATCNEKVVVAVGATAALGEEGGLDQVLASWKGAFMIPLWPSISIDD